MPLVSQRILRLVCLPRRRDEKNGEVSNTEKVIKDKDGEENADCKVVRNDVIGYLQKETAKVALHQISETLKDSAKRRAPGCMNAAGKVRQK